MATPLTCKFKGVLWCIKGKPCGIVIGDIGRGPGWWCCGSRSPASEAPLPHSKVKSLASQ